MGSNYYLKSDRDIFKKHYIKLIRHRENGNDFYALYDVMLHESIDHNGELRNSEVLPFDDDTLCMVAFGDCIIQPKDIKHYTSIVHDGLALFKDLGLIEIREDGTIFMLKLADKLGTTSAKRVEAYRSRQRQEKEPVVTNGNVTVTLQPVTCNIEKCNDNDHLKNLESIDESKEKEIEEKGKEIPFGEIVKYWMNKREERKKQFPDKPLLPGIQDHVSESRKKEIRARVRDYGIDKVYEMINKAFASDYLNGINKDKWIASFDWCFTQTYFPRVLEDNYINKGGSNYGFNQKHSTDPKFEGVGVTI